MAIIRNSILIPKLLFKIEIMNISVDRSDITIATLNALVINFSCSLTLRTFFRFILN